MSSPIYNIYDTFVFKLIIQKAIHNWGLCYRLSQDSVTVSGNKAEVEKLVKRLTKDGLFAKSVQSCGVAFHSPALFTVGPLLESLLKPIIPKPKTRSKSKLITLIWEQMFVPSLSRF